MTTADTYPLTWDLDALLPNPQTDEFRSIVDQFRGEIKELAEQSDNLPTMSAEAGSVAAWVKFLRRYQDASSRAVDLNAHAGCHAAADAGNKTYQQLEAELSALRPLQDRIATNIDFAVKEASDSDLKGFLDADDWLGSIRFFFEEARHNSALRLPKSEESLDSELAVDGFHAWGRLYDRISGGLKIRVMQKGEVVEKSPGQVHFDSAQRAVRENNFFAANKAWNTIGETCADALNHICGTRLTRYRRLGTTDHLDSPLRHNRMQRKTLTTMWDTITEKKPVLLKYFEKKAELLGLDRLTWYDIDAPLPGASAATTDELSWDDACNLVIETFNGFAPDFGTFAQEAISNGWIEAENRPGKRQGGFCTGFPTEKQSRIFMTFTHSADSMSTLAHELGHAYHSHVLREQPLFLQDYPMNLAETASTFAEAVLGDERLKLAKSEREQLVILDKLLGDSVAFLMNIHARFLFENNFHLERGAGELTAERLSELMTAAQQEAYLGAFADDGWNPSFWISKLHFYITGVPFYNFPYTFGYLLSLGLYALADDAGADFPEQYRQLLIATGCKETEEAVQTSLGYDLTKPDFWTKSLAVVESRVEQFLAIAG